MKHMLVIPCIEKCPVALQRSTECSAKLSLLFFRLERHKRMTGIQRAIPQIPEAGSMKMIGTGFGNNIHHSSTGTSQLCPVSVRRNSELLHHFVGKLIWRAVSSTRLRKESVVIVRPVNQITRLNS